MPSEAIQSAITPASVAAAAITFDAQDRAVVGDVVMSFGEAGLLATAFAPREWESAAAYIIGLTEREPLKSSPAFACHRSILGAIGHELRTYARLAGEPVGLEADLRAAGSQAEERRIRARIADHEAAVDRMLDDLELATEAQHAAQPSIPSQPEGSEAEPAAPPAAERDVVIPWWMQPDAP